MRFLASLPVDAHLPAIAQALKSSPLAVLVSPPGTGKSTRVAPSLVFDSGFGKAYMLQPRRVAARALARRIAAERNFVLGHEVGYRIRFEDLSGPQTQLNILTEGLLTKYLLRDGDLPNIKLVIFDEFHERSLQSDLAFAMCLDLQKNLRGDLKILIMSATPDIQALKSSLGDIPVVTCEAKSFPVEVSYSSQSLTYRAGNELAERVCEEGLEFVRASSQAAPADPNTKDVLVFLPGFREIQRVQELLVPKAPGYEVLILHSQVGDQDQDRIFETSNRPRFILSTNIAETSITIPSVGTVIDSGLRREVRFESTNIVDQLETVKISKSSSIQRAGRAGRVGPGRALRLWSKMDHEALADSDVPEILKLDLLEARLALAIWGIQNLDQISFVTKPPLEAWQAAERELLELGALALGDKLQVTPIGLALSRLPLNPRWGKVLIEALARGVYRPACALVAHIMSSSRARTIRLDGIRESDLSFESKRVLAQLLALQGGTEKVLKEGLIPTRKTLAADVEAAVGKSLLSALPSRVCCRRQDVSLKAKMSNGRGIELVRGADWGITELPDWFVAIDLQGSASGLGQQGADLRLWSFLTIDPEWLKEIFPSLIRDRRIVEMSSQTGHVRELHFQEFCELPLSQPRQVEISSDRVQEVLESHFSKVWPKFFESSTEVLELRARIELLELHGLWDASPVRLQGQALNFLNLEFVKELSSYLCLGCARWADVEAKDWVKAALDLQPSSLRKKLEKEAPTHLTVPSGSRIPLQYATADRAPRLSVRLQEIFGWAETPRLCNGQVVVVVDLLAPNYRSVQVTSDLRSFWEKGYFEVRGDLRSRYPKHSWPEDPLRAPAQAKGRPRGNR